jgi:hypothetical protein
MSIAVKGWTGAIATALALYGCGHPTDPTTERVASWRVCSAALQAGGFRDAANKAVSYAAALEQRMPLVTGRPDYVQLREKRQAALDALRAVQPLPPSCSAQDLQ